jgi:hypothetical protein
MKTLTKKKPDLLTQVLHLFHFHSSASQASVSLKIKKPGLPSADLAFSL